MRCVGKCIILAAACFLVEGYGNHSSAQVSMSSADRGDDYQSLSVDPEEQRQRDVWARIVLLKPGMSLPQVEALLGRPVSGPRPYDGKNEISVTYWCIPTVGPQCTHIVGIVFDDSRGIPTLVRIIGPNLPWGG